MRELGERPDVDDRQQRVGGGLGPDEPGSLFGRGPGDGLEIGLPNGRVAHAPPAQHLVEQAERAAVGVAGDEHAVAWAAERADQAVLRGHAGGERERRRAVLQRGQARLQRGPRRVGGARVLVAAAGAADAVLLVGRGLVDRRDDRAGERVGVLAGVDGLGFEAELLAFTVPSDA